MISPKSQSRDYKIVFLRSIEQSLFGFFLYSFKVTKLVLERWKAKKGEGEIE